MNKAGKTAAKASTTQDAIAMLRDDHKLVKALFKEFESLKKDDSDDEAKAALVSKVCRMLTVHAQIEEEIFYPAATSVIDDEDLMDEALVEHQGAKQLIEQLEAMAPGDPLYDAKVTVLGELVDHHVKEEEGEMFPKVRKSELDLVDLGAQLAERRTALEAELGAADEQDAGPLLASRRKPARSHTGPTNGR